MKQILMNLAISYDVFTLQILVISLNNSGVRFEPTYTDSCKAIGKEGDGSKYNSRLYQGLGKYHSS